MKKHILFLFFVVGIFALYAANPTFNNFNQTQFVGTTNVTIKTRANVTNMVSASVSGSQIAFTATNFSGLDVVSVIGDSGGAASFEFNSAGQPPNGQVIFISVVGGDSQVQIDGNANITAGSVSALASTSRFISPFVITNSSGTLAGLNVGDTGGFATYGYTSGNGNAMFMGINGGTGTLKIDLAGNTTASGNSTASSFIGSGVGLTNLMGNSQQYTNGITFFNTTNCFANLSGGNPTINLTGDACLVAATNGPGEISMTFNCGDGANHNFLFPTAMHMQGNTNIISSVSGTNSLIVVTNNHVLTIVIRHLQVTANPNATNTIIFMGESAN